MPSCRRSGDEETFTFCASHAGEICAVHLRTIDGVFTRILPVCTGNVGILYYAIGEEVFYPDANAELFRTWFGGAKRFPDINDLDVALFPGVPTDFIPDGHLTLELACMVTAVLAHVPTDSRGGDL